MLKVIEDSWPPPPLTFLLAVALAGVGTGQRCDRTRSVKERELLALTVETAGLDSVRLLRFSSVRVGLEIRGGGSDEKFQLRMSIRFYDLYCVGSHVEKPSDHINVCNTVMK